MEGKVKWEGKKGERREGKEEEGDKQGRETAFQNTQKLPQYPQLHLHVKAWAKCSMHNNSSK